MGIDAATLSAIIFSMLGLCLLIGVPIGYSLGIATVAGLYFSPIPLIYIAQTLYTGTELFPLIAIPGFVLAGDLMIRSKITDKLIRLVFLSVGNIPGGLGVVTVVACGLFASISGSGPATTAAIGGIMISAMVKAGYPPAYAAAVTAAGGTLGVLIPPSNPMIIYGVVADLSIPHLFVSGAVPGLLLVAVLSAYCYITGRIRGLRGSGEKLTLPKFFIAFKGAIWALLMPIIVLGVIYTGMATPTEASMVAVLYTMILGFAGRTLKPSDIFEAMVTTGKLTGAILITMGPAMAFGKLLTMYQVPVLLGQGIGELTSNPTLLLLMVGGLLIIAGTFMEGLSTIILLTPVLLPVLKAAGADPVQFGILLVVMMEIGFLTPPLGVNVFVASAIAKLSIEEISKELIPLIAVLLLYALVIILFPTISTWGYHYMTGR
ncbi:TRAP transporter large permease [Hoeflea sp. WL0058]|uniref:TRAP transporter large permease protein n=1 Tax=Flavimaribacter sediminis TaxID=2865987 RepID=A0AAE3D0M9_9HYPH|nr:TRAP transporter large permease [Flavimaribacter sediminis]MBW8637884.1 TRAP transporter large permease [Flavimaribacter sediminis]